MYRVGDLFVALRPGRLAPLRAGGYYLRGRTDIRHGRQWEVAVMLDMKCAPMDGTVVVVCTQRGMWLANWSVSGWYGTAGCVRIDDEILGWWPIGNKWLDPAVVTPPRNTCFAALVGTGVSMPAIARWDVNRNEWFDCNSGSAVTVLGWLPLPGEDNT